MKRTWRLMALTITLIAVVLGCSPDGTAPTSVPIPPTELLATGTDVTWLGEMGDRRIRPVIAVYWRAYFGATPDSVANEPAITAGLAGEIAGGRVLLYQTQYIGPDLCLVPVEILLTLVDSIVVCQRDSILWLPEP